MIHGLSHWDVPCEIRRMFQGDPGHPRTCWWLQIGWQTCSFSALPGSEQKWFCPHPLKGPRAMVHPVAWANLLRDFVQLAPSERTLALHFRGSEMGSRVSESNFVFRWVFFRHEWPTKKWRIDLSTSSLWGKSRHAICSSESHSGTNGLSGWLVCDHITGLGSTTTWNVLATDTLVGTPWAQTCTRSPGDLVWFYRSRVRSEVLPFSQMILWIPCWEAMS